MVRLGGTATISHLEVFQGLETLFRRRGIDLEWVLYSDYDTMAEAFASGYIDLAWNGPLGYVKIRRLLDEPCNVIAMRDVDIGFTTHFIARADSGIETVEDLKGKRFAFGRRGSEQAGLVPHYLLKQAGINPGKDLSAASFFEQRASATRSDERDVVERVVSGEFDAGSVSQRTMETMAEDGSLPRDQVRIFLLQPSHSATAALRPRAAWSLRWPLKSRRPSCRSPARTRWRRLCYGAKHAAVSCPALTTGGN